MSERLLGSSARPVDEPDDDALTRMLRELPDAVLVVDASGIIRWGNGTAERFFGRSARDTVGASGLEFVHPEDLHLVLLSLATIQDKQVGIPIEIRLRTPEGWRLVELVGSPIAWLGEGSVLLCLRDLTDRRRFEFAHDADARFRAVVQNAAVVTMLVDPTGLVTSCSGALTRLLGLDPESIEGRSLEQLIDDADRPALVSAFRHASEGSGSAAPVTVTVRLTRPGEREAVPFELAIVNLIDDPTVGGYIVSGHDVTDRIRLEEELSYRAFHDSLTGLGNRALFQNRLGHALERTERTGGQLAVLFLDMDGLKQANDRLGHAVGDALLQSMASVLVGCIRKADTAARLGGDEFAVIVEDFSHPGEVFALAERILDECRRPLSVGTDTVAATVSIGFTFSKPGITVDELMSNADRAMYTAKYRGKDRYEQFEEWMLAAVAPV
jgi:diguanylate cyclase (GGDEF)-like protein/PAS domain S-box-containing protein